MLDRSAAFDKIGHSFLLETLDSGFVVDGTDLKWFTSYRSKNVVQLNGTLSE